MSRSSARRSGLAAGPRSGSKEYPLPPNGRSGRMAAPTRPQPPCSPGGSGLAGGFPSSSRRRNSLSSWSRSTSAARRSVSASSAAMRVPTPSSPASPRRSTRAASARPSGESRTSASTGISRTKPTRINHCIRPQTYWEHTACSKARLRAPAASCTTSATEHATPRRHRVPQLDRDGLRDLLQERRSVARQVLHDVEHPLLRLAEREQIRARLLELLDADRVPLLQVLHHLFLDLLELNVARVATTLDRPLQRRVDRASGLQELRIPLPQGRTQVPQRRGDVLGQLIAQHVGGELVRRPPERIDVQPEPIQHLAHL